MHSLILNTPLTPVEIQNLPLSRSKESPTDPGSSLTGLMLMAPESTTQITKLG